MTISSQTRKAGPFTGNGATTTFPFTFKVFAASDLYVVRTDAIGNDTVLVLGTDYTVTLNTNQNSSPGGSITLPTALASGFKLTATSALQYLQPTDLTNQGGFYPKVINDALDRLTIFCQQLFDQVGRSLKISIATPAGVNTTLPAPAANKLIGWNATADNLQNMDPTLLATIVAFGTANADKFSGTGAQTMFTLLANPGALNNLDVSISGVTQRPGIDYTWTSGTTLTFTSAPPAGANNVLVRYMQGLPQGYTDAGLVPYSDTGVYSSGSVGYRLKQLISSVGASLIGFIQAGIGAIARTLQDKAREEFSVTDFGADPTGATDSSTAINAALAIAGNVSTASNYRAVFLPDGQYKASNLVIPHGVRLYGNGVNQCQIIVTDAVNSCIYLKDFTDVHGITFYYPNQVTSGAPTVYPPTITTTYGAQHVRLTNLKAWGAYDFITLGNASYGAGPVWLDDISGFPLHRGITLDNCTDVPHINNVHFNPNIYGAYSSSLLAQVYQTAIALTLLRVDTPQVSNFHCFGYANGIYGDSGNPSGSVNMAEFVNCLFDVCRAPINLAHYQDGMFFTNCTFTTGGINYNGVTGGVNTIGTNTTAAQTTASFTNCSFRTYNTSVFNLTANATFANCTFDDFNLIVGSYAALNLGYAGIDVKLIGCTMDTKSRAGSQGITGTASSSLTLQGNTFANFSGATVANVTGKLFASGNILGTAAYTWNGVVAMDINGVLCTYQSPSIFTVTAAFSQGMRFTNYNITAAGQPKGWYCITSGTPGTWVSEGNL
jgi:hypothetical protein